MFPNSTKASHLHRQYLYDILASQAGTRHARYLCKRLVRFRRVVELSSLSVAPNGVKELGLTESLNSRGRMPCGWFISRLRIPSKNHPVCHMKRFKVLPACAVCTELESDSHCPDERKLHTVGDCKGATPLMKWVFQAPFRHILPRLPNVCQICHQAYGICNDRWIRVAG